MKKLLAFLLMLSMLLSFAACDSETANYDDDDDEEVSDKDKDRDDDDDDEKDYNLRELQNITFEPLTVMDNDDCKIEITKLEYVELFGYNITVNVENKGDQELIFSLESATANGVQLLEAFYYNSDIPAGESDEDVIQLKDEEMEKCGFYKFTELELAFKVINSEYEDVAAEEIVIHPYGTETAIGDFERASQEGDLVLVDNDYVSVVVYECEMDKDYGAYYMRYYAVNKTDAKIWIDFEDVSLNGIEVSSGGIEEIYPENAWFGAMYVWEFELEDNGIEEVEKIDFTLDVHTYDDRYDENDQFVDEDITVEP